MHHEKNKPTAQPLQDEPRGCQGPRPRNRDSQKFSSVPERGMRTGAQCLKPGKKGDWRKAKQPRPDVGLMETRHLEDSTEQNMLHLQGEGMGVGSSVWSEASELQGEHPPRLGEIIRVG